MNMKIQRALLKGFKKAALSPPAQLTRTGRGRKIGRSTPPPLSFPLSQKLTAQNDWTSDSGGKAAIDQKSFFESMFELVRGGGG
jgi:hypothetical protein